MKTLKDIEEDPIAMQHCNNVVSSYDLKQEVIKQIKEGMFDPFIFFNITEEDLK